MPRAYIALRDHLISQGLTEKKAKAKAAAVYNSRHPRTPVTNTIKKERKNKDNLEKEEKINYV